MVDSAVVGRFVGEQALAAVGASYSLTNVFIFVAGGGGLGASVIVSRYFGAKNYSKMKTAKDIPRAMAAVWGGGMEKCYGGRIWREPGNGPR